RLEMGGVVRADPPLADERPLEVDAERPRAGGAVERGHLPEGVAVPLERRGDERRLVGDDAGLRERRTRTRVAVRVRGEEVDAGEAVDVGVDEPRHREADAGGGLQAERALAERYGVARMTVRSMLDRLTSEGLTYRVHGRGTFAAEPRVAQAMALSSFSEDMLARGLRPGSTILRQEVVPAGGVVA